MDWFVLIYSLSFYFIIINIFKKIFLNISAVLIQILNERIQLFAFLICWIIPYYFFATVAAFMSLAMRADGGGFNLSIIAFLFLMIELNVENAKARNNSLENHNADAYKFTQRKSILIIIALLYFIVVHFKPELGFNPIIENLVLLIDTINGISWLSPVIIVISFLYAIYMIANFLFATVAVLTGGNKLNRP